MTAIVVLLSLMFVGIFGKQNAHAAAKQTFTVMVGQSTDTGADILAFAPQTIKVHRGDTITWKFAPVHNVHFVDKPVDQIIPTKIDGKDAFVLNPVIIVPNVQNGDSVKAGTNTGLLGDPSGPTEFTGVIDLAPGTYTYLCDIHHGMIGQIIVTEDTADVPSPADVEKQGKQEFADTSDGVLAAYVKAAESQQFQPKGDTLDVAAGFTAGTASVERFFPPVAIITAGQSIKWTVPAGLEPHSVTFNLPADGAIPPSLVPVTDSKNNTFLAPGPALIPSGKSGDEFTGQDVSSGLLNPTQTFELKFPKAGVYKYYCGIHPGHVGTVVVLSKS
jgi:plastocyanin